MSTSMQALLSRQAGPALTGSGGDARLAGFRAHASLDAGTSSVDAIVQPCASAETSGASAARSLPATMSALARGLPAPHQHSTHSTQLRRQATSTSPPCTARPACGQRRQWRCRQLVRRQQLGRRVDAWGAEGRGVAASAGIPDSEGMTAASASSVVAEELEEAVADATASAASSATAAGGDAGTDGSSSSSSGGSSEGGGGGGLLGSKEVGEMLGFALPALGMVLADPLMSLIDTACVGRVSSLQLAALGPTTAVFNFAFQLFAFLGVGTTNIIASNSLKTPGLDKAALEARREAAERTLCNSLQLALACGCLVLAVLLGCGRWFLAGMGTAPELLPLAWQYLSIRALAAPAVLVMAASQGACLGQQDAWTPFSVLMASGLLNAVGDIYLISFRGMGVAGAALATAAAQYLGAAYFLWHLRQQGRQPGRIRLRWTGLPRVGQMREFLLVAATLFTRTIFGMAAYFSMTSSATRLGTLATATHQVAMQTFWFLAYFPEPLSLAAQTLLAKDRGNPERAAHWAWLLLRSGGVLGVVLAAAVGAVFTRTSWLFTADVAVQSAVAQLAPVGMCAIAVCSVMMMFDGISVGSGSFGHLPPSNVAGLCSTLLALEAGRRCGWGLGAVWWALVAFYATRLSGHLIHYLATGGGVFAGSRSSASSGSSSSSSSDRRSSSDGGSSDRRSSSGGGGGSGSSNGSKPAR